jgi:hypothetical protein
VTKKINSIALTDMIKSLRYRDYAMLANKIRDIIKDKEDFNKYVIDEDKVSARADGRPEKFCVSNDCEVLVDNLAILMPFHSVFGKAKTGEKNSYMPLRILKNPKSRNVLKDALIEQRQRFERSLAKTQRNLNEIPIFAAAVLTDLSIDIEKQSLREMINSAPNNYKLSDLKDRYSMSIWSEIISFQDDIDNQQADSTTYQRLGEKLFLISENDDAILALDTAIELDPKNGIAQVILALIYQKRLAISKNTLHSLNAQNDYSGYISNPISSEEHWLNESLDLTQEQVAELHPLLIENVVNGLLNWPQHDFRPLSGNKNYVTNLNHSSFSDIQLSRQDLFFILLETISIKDYKERKTSINEIIESFISIGENGYEFFGCSRLSQKHDLDLLALMSFYSTKVAVAELKKRADDIRYDFNVYKKGKLEFFESFFVEHLYCQYIGRDAYFELKELLIAAQYEQAKIDNFQSKVTRFHTQISPLLKKISVHFTYSNPYISEEMKDLFGEAFFLQEQHKDPCTHSKTIENVTEHLVYINKEIQSWEGLINNPLWIRYSETPIEMRHVRQIVLYAALIELTNNINAETNLTLIIQLTEDRQKILNDVCVSDSPIEFMMYLADKINENCCLREHPAMTFCLSRLIDASKESHERFLDQFD